MKTVASELQPIAKNALIQKVIEALGTEKNLSYLQAVEVLESTIDRLGNFRVFKINQQCNLHVYKRSNDNMDDLDIPTATLQKSDGSQEVIKDWGAYHFFIERTAGSGREEFLKGRK